MAQRLRIAAILYLILLLIIWWGHITDLLILHPPAGPMNSGDAIREVIKLGTDDIELWHSRSPGAKDHDPAAYVLYFAGNADRADRWASFMARQWGDKPVEVVGVNLPGYGGSTGPAYLSKIPAAALAAYDFLHAKTPALPIFIQANSVGTTAALCVMARRDVAGATLQNPPPLQRLIFQHHGWWNAWLLAAPIAASIPSELNSRTNAPLATAPPLFILSEKDTIVPVNFQRLILQSYAGPTHTLDLPNASHNQGMDESAWDAVDKELDWLWQSHFPAPATQPDSLP